MITPIVVVKSTSSSLGHIPYLNSWVMLDHTPIMKCPVKTIENVTISNEYDSILELAKNENNMCSHCLNKHAPELHKKILDRV